MTKACYVGVAGKARKVKKIYTGVANKARKVKKAYVGVGGKARLFFSADQKLGYYGTVTGLSQGRDDLAATTVGDYGLFGGGVDFIFGNSYFATVDAYTTSLVRSTPTALSKARSALAATTVGDYGLFGGGLDSVNSVSAAVDAYTTSLVRSTPTALSKARSALAATTVGDYGLFGGGLDRTSFSGSATVDAYTTSLVRSTPTALSKARGYLAATTVGDYGLFGGSWAFGTNFTIVESATVDAYTTSLVRSTPTALSKARGALAATTVGDYGLFGGGGANDGLATVDAYSLV